MVMVMVIMLTVLLLMMMMMTMVVVMMMMMMMMMVMMMMVTMAVVMMMMMMMIVEISPISLCCFSSWRRTGALHDPNEPPFCRTVVMVLGVCFLGQELARVAASLWLTFWTSTMGSGRPVGGAAFYLGIYSALSILQVVLAALLTAFFKRSTLNASGSLHDTMLTKLMRSPMSFFHTNPLGRIINRCTKDVSSMDKDVADNINMFARSFLTLISTVALMGSVSPILLPFIVVVMVLFYFIYLYFQASVRECKRLESVSYSPLYTSLTDAITGLSTIRAYGQQSRLITSNRVLIDGTSRFALAQQSFNRWLSVRQVGPSLMPHRCLHGLQPRLQNSTP